MTVPHNPSDAKIAREDFQIFYQRFSSKNFPQKIVNEASYVYNWSGQKLIKNGKNGPFWNPEVCGKIGLPDRSLLIRQKMAENAQTFPTKSQISFE